VGAPTHPFFLKRSKEYALRAFSKKSEVADPPPFNPKSEPSQP
jgi:hypothetical protein